MTTYLTIVILGLSLVETSIDGRSEANPVIIQELSWISGYYCVVSDDGTK